MSCHNCFLCAARRCLWSRWGWSGCWGILTQHMSFAQRPWSTMRISPSFGWWEDRSRSSQRTSIKHERPTTREYVYEALEKMPYFNLKMQNLILYIIRNKRFSVGMCDNIDNSVPLLASLCCVRSAEEVPSFHVIVAAPVSAGRESRAAHTRSSHLRESSPQESTNPWDLVRNHAKFSAVIGNQN